MKLFHSLSFRLDKWITKKGSIRRIGPFDVFLMYANKLV